MVTALGVILLAIGNRVLGSMDRLQQDLVDLKDSFTSKMASVKDEIMADFIDLRDRVAHLEGRLSDLLKWRGPKDD